MDDLTFQQPSTEYFQRVSDGPLSSPVAAALRQQLMGNALPPSTPAYAPGGTLVSHAIGLYGASAPQAPQSPQGDTPIPWHALPPSSLVQQIPHYFSPERLLGDPRRITWQTGQQSDGDWRATPPSVPVAQETPTAAHHQSVGWL